MPIRYVDQDDIDELGAAAFLRIEPDAVEPGFIGAFLLINARGEPLEFTYSRVLTPESFMWRTGDLEQSALKKLSMSLLTACATVPGLLLCQAHAVPVELFRDAIHVAVPVGLVHAELEDTLRIEWVTDQPSDASTAARLLHELTRRHLVLEPFDRAQQGLSEVFGEREGGRA